MTIDELRKHYPFIGYGDEYHLWEKNTKWYEWLICRSMTERHSSDVGHDWNKMSARLYATLKERERLFRTLPIPTKEQESDDNDPEYPFKTGKWPEDRMPDIRSFCKVEAETRKVAQSVAAILTQNEYCIKVLNQKTYASKDWSKNDK